MRIVFHCHAGPGRGVGHLMRSLSLAEEALSSGHEVSFVGEYVGSFARRQLAAAGVEVRDGTLSDAVVELGPDVLHLDTYEDVETTSPVALVSNMEDGAYGRRAADLVVDPNLGAEDISRDGEPPRALLRGSRYAPLRRAVVERRASWDLQEAATRVLVVMGGTDAQGLTPRVLDLLARTGLRLQVTAIAQPGGTGGGWSPSGLVETTLVEPTDELPALMVQQDLVVSAAGTSVWELCCLGLPTALVCAVDNQREGYTRVVESGAAVGLGTLTLPDEEEVATDRLRDVLLDAGARRRLSERASSLVDGLGAWRVVRAWEQLAGQPRGLGTEPVETLSTRRATFDDAETLLRWRNDAATRRSSRSTDEVAWEQHSAWLAATLGRDDRLLLLSSDLKGDVGTVRWDRAEDGAWEVSVTVAPERRGESLSGPLLRAGERALLEAHGAREVTARVHEDNAPSRRLFASSGYLPDLPADDGGFLTSRKRIGVRPGPR